jgi:hypothetical protein
VAITVPGLSEGENDAVNTLLEQLEGKQRRNVLRRKYYDAKQIVQQLGIAVPPQFDALETVMGWPAKAVDILDRRVNFEGLVVAGESSGPFGLDEVFADNSIEVESSQAHTAAFKYACSFLPVTRGDVQSGEPEVLITPRSAMDMTGVWDSRRRMLASALSVIERTDGQVSEFVLYLPDRVVTARKTQRGWVSDPAVRHRLRRVPVALLPYKPDLDRPFGKSKISRTVMSLTDQAVRTMLRTELSAEFYSSPQRAYFNVVAEAFQAADGSVKTGFETAISKALVFGPNEEGTPAPSAMQFPQMTMQPHTDMLRQIAANFAGEANIPVNSLGIIHENPASDAAMQTAYLDLVQDAERCHTTFGAGYVSAGQFAVMVRDNLDAVPDELKRMRAKFRDASTGTKAAASQAVVEQVKNGILPADSEVTLEALGYDDVTIQRIVADRRRAQAGDRLAQLVDAARQATSTAPAVPAPVETAPEVA